MSVRAHLANPVDRRSRSRPPLANGPLTLPWADQARTVCFGHRYAHLVELLRSADWAADVATLGLEPENRCTGRSQPCLQRSISNKNKRNENARRAERPAHHRCAPPTPMPSTATSPRLLDSLAVVSPHRRADVRHHRTQTAWPTTCARSSPTRANRRTPAQEPPTVGRWKNLRQKNRPEVLYLKNYL